MEERRRVTLAAPPGARMKRSWSWTNCWRLLRRVANLRPFEGPAPSVLAGPENLDGAALPATRCANGFRCVARIEELSPVSASRETAATSLGLQGGGLAVRAAKTCQNDALEVN